MDEEKGFILRRLLLIVLVCVIVAAIVGVISPFPLFTFGLVLLIEGILLVLVTKNLFRIWISRAGGLHSLEQAIQADVEQQEKKKPDKFVKRIRFYILLIAGFFLVIGLAAIIGSIFL